jgi:hypothetical protein
MRCANPGCHKELIYLREGRLEVHELETPFRERLPVDNGFPANPVPSRFFWLCGECMKTHVITRWTTSGPIVELNPVRVGPFRVLADFESDSGAERTLLSA